MRRLATCVRRRSGSWRCSLEMIRNARWAHYRLKHLHDCTGQHRAASYRPGLEASACRPGLDGEVPTMPRLRPRRSYRFRGDRSCAPPRPWRPPWSRWRRCGIRDPAHRAGPARRPNHDFVPVDSCDRASATLSTAPNECSAPEEAIADFVNSRADRRFDILATPRPRGYRFHSLQVEIIVLPPRRPQSRQIASNFRNWPFRRVDVLVNALL